MWELNFDNIYTDNCCESMLYLLMEYKKYDIPISFLHSFSSHYFNDEKKNVIEKLNRTNRLSELLKQVYNIEIITKKPLNEIRTLSLIQKTILDTPIGIVGDTYDCNWTLMYHNTHFEHFFLVLNDLKNEEAFLCADIYYPKVGYFKLSYNALINICNNITQFIFPETNFLNMAALSNFLIKSANFPDYGHLMEEKSKMVNFFLTEIYHGILTPDNLEHSAFLLKLKMIIDDHKYFKEGLYYLSKKISFDIFENVYPLLTQLTENWVMLKNMLIRFVLSGIKNKDNFINLCDQIFTTNYKVSCELYIIFNSEDFKRRLLNV